MKTPRLWSTHQTQQVDMRSEAALAYKETEHKGNSTRAFTHTQGSAEGFIFSMVDQINDRGR
jgi:hypothetical protein